VLCLFVLGSPAIAGAAAPVGTGDVPQLTALSGTSGLQCPSPGNCTVAGVEGEGTQSPSIFVLTELDGTWGTPTVLVSLPFDGATQLGSSGLSCPSVGNCELIGGAFGDGSDVGFVSTEAAGKWGSPQLLPVPSTSLSANRGFSASFVACPSTGSCVVVGSFETAAGTFSTYLDTESSGKWSTRSVAYGLGTGFGGPVALACGAVGDCVLAGEYSIPSNGFTPINHYYVDMEQTGIWSGPTSPPMPSDATGYLDISAAACAGPSACTVVGQYGLKGVIDVYAASESRGSWLPARKIQDSLNLGHEGNFTSVSCAAPLDCTAGGTFVTKSDHVQGLLATEYHGRWAPTRLLELASRSIIYSQASAIDCITPTECMAIGYEATESDGALRSHAIAVRESGAKRLGVAEPIDALSGLHQDLLTGIACTEDDNCTAVGYFDDSLDPFETIDKTVIAAEANGVWST
jgi:hypothetical protein